MTRVLDEICQSPVLWLLLFVPAVFAAERLAPAGSLTREIRAGSEGSQLRAR